MRARKAEADISFFSRLLFAAYFLEAGLVLVVAPWSRFWERNLFLAAVPGLEGLVQNLFLRGAVTGVGVITAFAGLAELASAVSGRAGTHAADPPPPGTGEGHGPEPGR